MNVRLEISTSNAENLLAIEKKRSEMAQAPDLDPCLDFPG